MVAARQKNQSSLHDVFRRGGFGKREADITLKSADPKREMAIYAGAENLLKIAILRHKWHVAWFPI